MDLIAALQFLNLNQVPQDWVDAVWDLEFTERQPLDAMMEDELAAAGEKSFRTLYRCLMEQAAEQQRSSGQEGVSQGVWVVLGESGVSVKSLVAVLSHFILTAKAKEGGVQQRVCGLYAASVYLLLLGVPGSIANKVFHEVLLDTCSDLPSHCWPQEHGRKRKKDALKASQADGKRSKPQRRDAMEMDLEEEEEEEEQHFSGQDLMKIRDAIALLVQSLLRLLQTFPLKDRTQSASNCTQIFSKLLSFEPVVGGLTFSPPRDLSELKSIPEMAFYGLKLLCSPKHGDQKESLRRVFYRLLYVILMMNKVHGRKPSLLVPNQAVLNTRDQAIHFVCHLVEELKDLALPLLQILLQHICFQMVEKSEYRSHGAQAVGMLTSQMVSVDYACFIKWLFSFSSHSKMVHRLFSVDVVMVLLAQPERSVEDCQDPELARFLPQRFLIQEVLFARRNDESPTVQGHALSCLAQCLELPSLNVTRAVHDLFSATGTQTVLEEELTAGTSGSQKSYRTLPFRTVELSSTSSSSCEAKENLALLLRRVGDPKTNVRKAALQALVGLLKHGVIPATWENLESLSERSRDPAVSVRKKALQCLGELLAAKPSCRAVQKAWLHCVVPAVMDTESSMQEKALELLDQVLLSQVKPYNERSLLDHSQSLTWDLLGLLCDESQNLSRYFSRAFSIWSKQNKFSPAFISSLVSHTQTDHAAGAWLLLSKAVSSVSRVPHGQILDAWDTMIRSDSVNVTSCCHILSVVGDVAAHLNEDTKERIIADLMSRLKTFRLPLEVISAAMDTLYQLGCSEDIRLTQAFLNQHCGELVSICEAYLAGIILNENKTQDLNEDLMIKHLHTLGAASLHCPAKVGRRTVLLVESVLTSPSKKLADGEEDLPTSQPLTQFRDNELPSSVKAHGVITLGKLCLQQEKLAQRYLPVFARELEVGPDVAVRNNVAVIMCDLCVRYTSMVDLYIPNVSACLRDNSAVVRENALIMLTNLLQEEFVKWKGSLFFRFMMALVDPVPAIASLCEYCLLHRLLKKNPEMFSQHFIECIFHFNSYDKHTSYNKFPQSDREKAGFSLRGAQNREKRFRIYRFLLEHFTDAQRFNTTNKISQTVLACFAEEELPLDSDGAEVLSETFNVLSLKEFKLQAVSAPAGGAEESEEENVATMTKVVLQVAQRKVVSQVQKKAFIENTVPLIISLKNLLEQKRSPVLKDLMAYLQVTMQDYRNEVKEFFAGDEQLAAEVEFALNTAEKEREMAEKMESCSLMANGPTTLPKGSELLSPARRPLLPFNFTTPQPPPPSSGPTRLAHTDRRPVRPSRKEDHCRTKSMTPDKTAIVRGGAKDRAVSTPKGFEISLTFNEGLSAILSDPGTSFSGESSIRSNGQPAPGPRRWNVLSPLRQKKKSS